MARAMQAYILAGGQGTRLYPLTKTQPKPLVPLIDHTILDTIIGHLQRDGFDEITLLGGYRGQQLASYAAQVQRGRVSLRYVPDPSPLGTAGSVLHALLSQPSTQPFLVVSGDGLTTLNFARFYRRAIAARASAALLLAQVDDARPYGLVTTDDRDRIVQFVEKPDTPRPGAWVNTGIYVFHPKIFRGLAVGQPLDFGHQLFPQWLQQHRRLMAFKEPGYWSDVGTLAQYRQAIEDLLARRLVIPEEAVVLARPDDYPQANILSPCVIAASARIEPGATVGPYTVVGAKTVIRSGAVVQHSLVRAGAVVGRGSELTGTIVAEGARVGARARLEPGAVVGAHAVVADFTPVPPGTLIDAGIAWPKKNAAAAAALQKNSEAPQTIPPGPASSAAVGFHGH